VFIILIHLFCLHYGVNSTQGIGKANQVFYGENLVMLFR